MKTVKIKNMRLIIKLFVFFIIFSCNHKPLNFQQYINYPVKFGKQKIINQDYGFSIFIPKNWLWKTEKYENDKNYIFTFQAFSDPEKNKIINGLTITKIKSFENNKDLKSEYKYLLNLIKNKYGKKSIIESGKTEIFKQKAYYYYLNFNGIKKEPTDINFIMKSKQSGEFYLLGADISKPKDFKKNMAILLQCLITFKELDNE